MQTTARPLAQLATNVGAERIRALLRDQKIADALTAARSLVQVVPENRDVL
jgi:hypothetical protein